MTNTAIFVRLPHISLASTVILSILFGSLPARAQTSEIIGSVKWNANPIPNATVQLKNVGDFNLPVLASAMTASDGSFVISNPPTGQFTIYALSPSAEYWQWVGRPVTITAGQRTDVGTLSLAKILQLVAPANNATVSTTAPILQWMAFSGATSYAVEVYDQLTSANVFNRSTTATQVPVSPALSAGRMYQWSVDAFNATGEIAYYSAWYFTVAGASTSGPAIANSSLPNGTAGTPYSQMLTARGGTPPYSNWVVTAGSLPQGLTLNSSTGLISGIPATAGSFTFSATVRDATGATSAPTSFSLTVLVASGLRSPALYVGAGVIGEFDATTGSPINANLITGQEPTGLVLSGNTLFVANYSNGTVSTYDATTGAAISTGFITGLSYPDGLALSGNTLFVSNQNPGTIGVYDATTGAAINGRFITGLDRPGRLVVSDNNTLFAISGNTVGAYNATSGVSINGSFSRGLSDAVGLAVSGTTLFVSDFGIGVQGAGTVSTYNTTTGAVINAPLITGLSGPEGLAISGNTLFVASFGSFPPVAGAATVGAYNATTGAAIAAKFITGLTAATELAVAGPPVSQLPGSLLPQTIAFGALSNVTLGIAPFTLSATASSGLAVTFASATPSDCTVSGNTVTIIGAGTCSITASQSGNSSYAAAAPVTRSFTVNSASGASLSVTSGLLNFQIPQGAAAQSQALQIGGTAGTAWQATATSTGGAWLSVLPGAGQIPASLMAVVNPGGLAVGTYQGRITIQAPGATPPSIAIGVTLTVTAASGQGGGATIENLKFTGTATCIDSFCAHFGSGPITGTYSLNVTAQTIDGPWMFSGPFGTISSTDPGAKATVYVGSANVQSVFDVSTSTFEEFVKINFPPSDVQQLGAVIEAPGTNACINVPGGVNGSAACDPDYLLTGATTLVSVSGPPSITPGGIVPFYSTVSTIQPGELVSIYGTNLAASTASWNGDFPSSLGGTSVTINGKPAYLVYISPTQINLQAPDDSATGPVPVVVTTASGTATSTVTLAQFGPSFLLFDSKHVAGVIARPDGSGAYRGGAYDLLGPTGRSLGYATVAAKPGDSIALFAVGLGPTNPPVPAGQAFSGAAPATNPVNLLINNVSVTPDFAGLSAAGLYQINVTVPAGLGTGDVSLLATVAGARTQSNVAISVQPAPAPLPRIQSLTLSPNSVASGGTATGSVVLSGAAPPGGAIVALSSGSSAASVPATVTVPAGAASASFNVSASTVSSNQTVTISASYNGQSVQATLTVAAAANSTGNCQAVSRGPYQFQVWNTLSTDILVQFGDVVLPSGQHGSLPFGAQMRPNECDIIGLPQIASYAVAVSRYPNGPVVNNTLTFTDTTSGFVFNGRSAYTLRVTQGGCSAAADRSITFEGNSVYSLCLP